MSGYTRGYSLTKIGALIVISSILFLGGFGYMTNRTLDGTSTVLFVRVPTADGLKKGDAVLLRGVQVGEVKSIDFSETSVVVRAKLTQLVPLTSSASAALVAADMFGRQTLVLRPGAGSSEPLADGDTLAGVPAASMSASIDGLSKSAQRMINDTTTELLREALVGLTEATRQIGALAATTRSTIDSKTAHIDSIAAGVASSLTSVTAPAAHTMAQLDSTAIAMRAIVENLHAGDGNAARIMNDSTLYLRINETLASLEALVTDLRVNPKRYVNFKLF
jgi:phospholipid/cholesterol/gamma-HCH transport system substrate-binding protein